MSKTKTYWKGYSEKHQTPEFSISSQKEFQDDVPVDEFLGSDGTVSYTHLRAHET